MSNALNIEPWTHPAPQQTQIVLLYPLGLCALPPPSREERDQRDPDISRITPYQQLFPQITYHIRPVPSGRGRVGMHKHQKRRSARSRASQTHPCTPILERNPRTSSHVDWHQFHSHCLGEANSRGAKPTRESARMCSRKSLRKGTDSLILSTWPTL